VSELTAEVGMVAVVLAFWPVVLFFEPTVFCIGGLASLVVVVLEPVVV
jgi:hypothetical protein